MVDVLFCFTLGHEKTLIYWQNSNALLAYYFVFEVGYAVFHYDLVLNNLT